MMVVISLASLRMRTVSHAGALPPCKGKLAIPVLNIIFNVMLWIGYFSVLLCCALRDSSVPFM
jgi:hypothetical protein